MVYRISVRILGIKDKVRADGLVWFGSVIV